MTERVTIKDLENVCRRINDAVNGNEPDEFGAPLSVGPIYDPLTRKARVGKFYIDGAYGGYALYRIVGEGGGVTDVLRVGHVPKRELRELMFAFLEGMDYAKN